MKPRIFAINLLALSALAGVAGADEIRWSQPPDMDLGTDYLSMHRIGGPVVVDDFIVDKPTILGYRWWGSYFQDDPNLQPGQSRSVDFEISFHPDCPANAPLSAACPGDPRPDPQNPQPYPYSTPGQPYSYQLPVSATETFYGTTNGGERVYEYAAKLPTPIDVTLGAINWVDIAWGAGQFGTDAGADVWGWHESNTHNLDDAVQTDRAANPGGIPHLGPWNRLVGTDMAFQVITVPEPDSLWLILLGLPLARFLGARRRA